MADGTIKIDTKIDQSGIDKGIKDMQKNLNGAADKLKGAGKKMSAAVTAPIVGLGTVAFAAADQVDKAYRDIRVGTGATGEDLEKLKQNFQDVFVDVPDSADQVAGALSNLNTFTGYTGDALRDLTKQTLDAARTLDEDGVAASEAFGKALNGWNIPADEAGGHLDHLYKLTQDYGVGLGDLSGMVSRHGTVLKNAGFEMDEVAHFMASMEANGIQVSRVMPGLNQATRKWAEEGKNAKEELGKVIDEMKNAETETEALALATEVFGAQGAQRMVDAVRNGAIPALDDLGSGFDEASGVISDTTEDTRTIGEEFQILKNKAMVALEPLGRILIDLAKQAIDPLVEGIQRVAEWFQNLSPHAQKLIVLVGGIAAAIGPLLIVVGSLVSAFTTILPIIKAVGAGIALLASPVGLIIAAIAALVAVVVIYWEEIRDFTIEVFTAIGEFLSETWEWIKETAIEVWTAIADFFTDTWEAIQEKTTEVFTAISDFLSDTWETISDTVSDLVTGLIEFFTESWESAQETVTSIFTAISDFFADTWEGIKSTVSTIVVGILDFFETRWNNLKTNTMNIFNSIRDIIIGIWNGVRNTTSTIITGIRDTISGIWNSIRDTTSGIWNGISNTLSSIWNGFRDSASSAFNAVKDTITGVWESISGATSRIWDGIVESIKGAINGVIGAINGMLNGLSNINIRLPRVPSWVPGIGGRGGGTIGFPSIPNIPSLDVGTNLVTRDGLAMIHAGEAIVPAEHAGPYREGGGGKQIVIENVMNVDGEELYRIQEPYIDSSMSDKVTIESYMRGER